MTNYSNTYWKRIDGVVLKVLRQIKLTEVWVIRDLKDGKEYHMPTTQLIGEFDQISTEEVPLALLGAT